jgi:hypothetical protein
MTPHEPSRQDQQDTRQDNQDVVLAVIKTDIGYIKQEVKDMSKSLSTNYWSRQEGEVILGRLKLLEKVVYGIVGTAGVLLVAYLSRGFSK